MEGDKLIINSNNSCLLCFKKMGGVELFPLHQLTHKLNLDLGNVFPDVVSRFGAVSSLRLGKLQLFCDLCESCTDSCREIENKLPGGLVKSHVKVLLDKLGKVELWKEYDRETKALGLIHFGIVERLRKEIMVLLSQLGQKSEQLSSSHVRPSKNVKVGEDLSQMETCSMITHEIIEENPFQNDIVIENILSFLEIEEVKKCRLINTQWSENGYWTIKQIITDPCLRFDESLTHLKQLELLSLLESDYELPLASHLSISAAFLEGLQKEGNIFKFFNGVSSKLTKLTISTSRSMEPTHEIIYPEKLTFPHLAIITFIVKTDLRNYKHFELCQGIVLNSPRLVDISLSLEKEMPSVAFQPFVDLLRERQVINRLTSLRLVNNGRRSISSTHYKQLGAKMRLKKVELHPINSTAVSILHFLERQSQSLEELKINFGSAQFELKRLPWLKVLKISGPQGTVTSWNLIRISYKELFPSLEHLLLRDIKRPNLDIFLHSGTVEQIGPSIKELTMKNTTCSPEYIVNAAYLFPNLTKLNIPANLEFLRKVYRKMRKLQELTLDYGFCEQRDNGGNQIDNLLMGVEPQETDSYSDIYFNPDESLLALTELRVLQLNIKRFTTNVDKIGDDVCRRVLMKMVSLKVIKLQSRNIRISHLVLKEMRKMMVISVV